MITKQDLLRPRLIIDANSIIASALLNKKDPKGRDIDGFFVNTANYGYGNFIAQLLTALQKTNKTLIDIVAVFDGKDSRASRRRIWDEYKAHREERPKEFYKEFNKLIKQVKNLIKSGGGICVSYDYVEADDVIAHFVKQTETDHIVWTRDSDMLAYDCTVLLDRTLYPKSEPLSNKRTEFIPRKYIPLWRALVGDPGDFGKLKAKGFGPKAFVKLLQTFGDEGIQVLIDLIERQELDALQEDVAEMKELQKLIDSQEDVYITWALAQPVYIEDHKLKWEAGFPTKIDEHVFEELSATQHLITAETIDELKQELPEFMNESKWVALDLETDVPEESRKWSEVSDIDVDVRSSHISGGSITFGSNQQYTCYFSVNHADTDNVSLDDFRQILEMIPEDMPVMIHNASGFELPVLYRAFGDFWKDNRYGGFLPNAVDTQFMASYVDENNSKSLKKLSYRWFKYHQTTYEEVTQGRGMSEVTGEEVLGYGCDDTIMSSALFNLFSFIMEVEQTITAFCKVDLKSQYATAHAFFGGINFDTDRLAELEQKDREVYNENYAKLIEHLKHLTYEYEDFDEDGNDITVVEYWPGAQYQPITKLTPKEIKRANLIATGNELKTNFRKLEKVIALVEDEHLKNLLMDSLESKDFTEVNQYLEECFVPNIDFNVKSPNQVVKLMYDFMGLPVRFRNDLTEKQKEKGMLEGNPSSDDTAIEWALKRDAQTEEHKEILKAIQNCRMYRTRKGYYYDAYPKFVHWETGKIHPGLRQCGTSSRRFAPAKPNVNQLSKRTPEGKQIRSCVKPHKEGAVIFAPDFSGQELRLAALASGDKNFLACYIGEEKKDLHSLTGFSINTMLGGPYSTYEEFAEAVAQEIKESKEFRAKGKSTNFLAQYGGQAGTLSRKLVVDVEEAQLFLNARADAFPGLVEWSEDMEDFIRENKYSLTMLGARRHLAKALHSSDPGHAIRSGTNFIIQGSAAEMTKRALGRIFFEVALYYDMQIYFPVHDEVVMSVMLDDLVEVAGKVRDIMNAPYPDSSSIVPFEASCAVGFDYCNLTEIEWEAVEEWVNEQL